MSAETLQFIQKQIRYCPVCGEASIKEFTHYSASNGEWTCDECEQTIDVYLVDAEEEALDEDETKSSLLLISLVIGVAGYLYITLSF